MKSLIVYSSQTKNTKKLADTIYDTLEGEKDIFTVDEAPSSEGYDYYSYTISTNTKLTKLACGSNQIANLDLNSNTTLTELSCYNNELTSLDISINSALTKLVCSSNDLISLDVSSNTSLSSSSDHTSPFLYAPERLFA